LRIAVLVLAAVVVVSWIAGRFGGRISERLDDPLADGSAIVMRLCTGTALSLLAIRAALRGGYAWIESAAFIIGAVWFFAMGGLLIWRSATGKLDSADPEGGE
jgi:hypothetical protein